MCSSYSLLWWNWILEEAFSFTKEIWFEDTLVTEQLNFQMTNSSMLFNRHQTLTAQTVLGIAFSWWICKLFEHILNILFIWVNILFIVHLNEHFVHFDAYFIHLIKMNIKFILKNNLFILMPISFILVVQKSFEMFYPTCDDS